MADEERERPSLEPPKLFGRRKQDRAPRREQKPDHTRGREPEAPPADTAPSADEALDADAARAREEAQSEARQQKQAQREQKRAERAGQRTRKRGERAERRARKQDQQQTERQARSEEPDEGSAPTSTVTTDHTAADTALLDGAFVDTGTEVADTGEARPAPDERSTSVATTRPSTEDPEPRGRPRRVRKPRFRAPASVGPPLTGHWAAVATGAVVGALLLGLTNLGFLGCQVIRGTNSCGTGPGIAFLIVIFALGVLFGGYLLRWCEVPDPGSTSFLAMGLTSVVALLFLVDVLATWPMLIVIPVLSAATYLGSWWVTTSFVDTDA